jgi:hypothetical protein
MKKRVITLLFLGLFIICPVIGQEIYWDNGYCQIIKANILFNDDYYEDRYDDLYSLLLYDDNMIKIKMVYDEPYLFIVLEKKVTDTIEIVTMLANEEYKAIFNFDSYIYNWKYDHKGEKVNKEKNILRFEGNSEFINFLYFDLEGDGEFDTDIYAIQRELKNNRYTFLPKVLDAFNGVSPKKHNEFYHNMNLDSWFYYSYLLNSLLEDKENILNVESLQIILPGGTEKTFSTEYQKQAIQEMFRIGFRLGLK